MYSPNTHFHFIGIGGIGMSGLAIMLTQLGYRVTGCDLDTTTKTCAKLKNIGCVVTKHGSNLCFSDVDTFIYSSAINSELDELITARREQTPIMHRSQLLAQLIKHHPQSIGIVGSHGKTTVSAMITHIMMHAGLSPSFCVGGLVPSLHTHAKAGSGKLLIAEIDESDRSLLNMYPSHALITNLDHDHHTTYRSMDEVISTFGTFIDTLKAPARLYLGIDCLAVRQFYQSSNLSGLTYGLHHDAEVRGLLYDQNTTMLIYLTGKKLGSLALPMAGVHNAQNLLGAIAVCLDFGITFEQIKQGVNSFQGVDRRFCVRGSFHGATVIEDYAHHPTEIDYTLTTAKSLSYKKIHVIFEPHRPSRLHALWNEFVHTFTKHQLGQLIVIDLYGAHEAIQKTDSSHQLAREIGAQNTYPSLYLSADKKSSWLTEHLAHTTQPNDLIICIGAGRINQIASCLLADNS
jgi:UDP-N-acetylmuramate--alanine ligase